MLSSNISWYATRIHSGDMFKYELFMYLTHEENITEQFSWKKKHSSANMLTVIFEDIYKSHDYFQCYSNYQFIYSNMITPPTSLSHTSHRSFALTLKLCHHLCPQKSHSKLICLVCSQRVWISKCQGCSLSSNGNAFWSLAVTLCI